MKVVKTRAPRANLFVSRAEGLGLKRLRTHVLQLVNSLIAIDLFVTSLGNTSELC